MEKPMPKNSFTQNLFKFMVSVFLEKRLSEKRYGQDMWRYLARHSS